MNNLRAAIYYRHSIADKSEQVTAHLNELRQYSREQNWNATEYLDNGLMGKKDNRHAFQRLMKEARAKQVDVILCYSLSRWASSLPQLISTLSDLKGLGIQFVSMQDSINLNAIGTINGFLKNLKTERIRTGMIQSKALGIQCGRKATDSKKIAQVIEVYLQDEKLSVRDIAKKIDGGLPKSTVFKILTQYREGLINQNGASVRQQESVG